MKKKELLSLFNLPSEKSLSKIETETLGNYLKTVDEAIETLSNYRSKLEDQLTDKKYEPRLKELAQKIFDAYPEVGFIAILERSCNEDDSGNCWWETEGATNALPDIEEDDSDSRWTDEIESAYEELYDLFTKLHPDLNFDDEENAWWRGPAVYYGIDRDFDAARWEEED